MSVSRRVFLLEFSGPTLGMIRERLDRLPTLRRLLQEGVHGRLVGPLQPSATTSYSTLLTGRNPGRTGAFDSFRFPAGTYDRIPFPTESVQSAALFRRVSDSGRRVGLLNVPFLDPLPRVEGFAVSGDEGVGEVWASPPDVLAELREAGYRVPFGASYVPGRETDFWRHVEAVLAMRAGALRALFTNRSWDFGMATLFSLGELLHAFWKYYDPRHPDHRAPQRVFDGGDPLVDALVAVDRTLAEIVEMTGPDGLVIAMGAWSHRLESARVHLNAALHRRGLLAFRKAPLTRLKRAAFRLGLGADAAERLVRRLDLYRRLHYGISRGGRAKVVGSTFLSHQDVDWRRTEAVAMGYLGQVYLNVRGQRPAGTIPSEKYRETRDTLRRDLSGLRHPRSGEPLVERVWAREELYSGPELPNAPDLIVECREGYVADSGFRGAGRVVTRSPASHTSDHWHEGFLFAGGAGVKRGEIHGRLEDVAPTVLRALGLEDPGCDGRPLPIFRSDF